MEEGPNEQSHLVEYYRVATRHHAATRGPARAQRRRRRGVLRGHADRRGLSGLRDPRPARARARGGAGRSTRIRALFQPEPHGLVDWRRPRPQELLGGAHGRRISRSATSASRSGSCFAGTSCGRASSASASTETPDGEWDLPEFIREHREDLVLKPNRAYGGTGVQLGSAQTETQWDAVARARARAASTTRHESGSCNRRRRCPCTCFPSSTATARTRDEPFYAVMGFAPTDHGLSIICRVSQKAGRQRRAARRARAPCSSVTSRTSSQLDAHAGARRPRAEGAPRVDLASSAISTP